MELENLDAATRALMGDEISIDVAAARLYVSPRLAVARTEYERILRAAAEKKDTLALANDLRQKMHTHEQRAKRSGGYTLAKVPFNAADTLAEGEFNRFYIRALCRRATAEGRPLEIYRAKQVGDPRPQSEARLGVRVDPQALLADLRENIGVDTALGVPGGVNSGLSVRFAD